MGAGMMGAGMAMNWLGGQLQGWASVIDKWAMEDAFKGEMKRQEAYQKAAMQVFQQQTAGSGADAAIKALGDAATQRKNMYSAAGATPLSVNRGYKPSAGEQARSNFESSQRADLMKYGDWQHQQKIANMGYARQLDQISDFAGGHARTFPYLMYDAQHKMDVLAEVGSAISSVGSGSGAVANAFRGNQPPGSGSTGAPYGYSAAGPPMTLDQYTMNQYALQDPSYMYAAPGIYPGIQSNQQSLAYAIGY